VVDEAHALGCLGPAGRGVCAEAGVVPDVVVGTLGKAFGTFGAFALASRAVCRLLENRARSFVFTTALPPAVAAAGLAAVELAAGASGDRLRTSLFSNINMLYSIIGTEAMAAQDVERSAIVPIVIGDESATMARAEALLAQGYYAQGIRPPTVPAGTSRLRIAVTATHTEQDIRGLAEALRKTS
jgi:7-keto-8-aminopelargonate synthetase-like enzyme